MFGVRSEGTALRAPHGYVPYTAGAIVVDDDHDHHGASGFVRAGGAGEVERVADGVGRGAAGGDGFGRRGARLLRKCDVDVGSGSELAPSHLL